MSKISTKEVFDMYFAEKDPVFTKKTRGQIDRHEVYEYEQKLGKQIFEMTVDELFEMILSFNDNNRNNNSSYKISYSSYDQIASAYRSVFNFYIDNIAVIRNPFNDKRMRGMEAVKRLASSKAPITWEQIEDIIKRLHSEYEEDRARYIECIILLFYEGFAKAEEIVLLTEKMINFKTKEVYLSGRTITLSDRCFELLIYVHNMTTISGLKHDYLMENWNDGYFKYAIRYNFREEFKTKPMENICNIINKKILVDVNGKLGVDINYRKLFYLGFYDYIVKRYGESKTKELITSVRNSDEANELLKVAREYGLVVTNITQLKKTLRPYV